MKKISGRGIKNKGKNGERELAKILEDIFSLKFIRVPNSGAFVGGKNFCRKKDLDNTQLKLMRGDIIVPENFPNIIFECKFYKKFSIRNCLRSKYNLLDDWISQIESVATDELWFLCIKINNQGWLILFDHLHFKKFNVFSYLNYVSKNERNYIITDMKIFLESNKEIMKNL